MMKKYFIIVLTLLALIRPSSGFGSTTITIGYQASLAPLHSPSVILSNIKKICLKAKLGCKFIRYPLKRGAYLLKSGLIDALLTIDDQQFRHCCNSSLWTTPAFYGLYAKEKPIHIPRHEQDLLGHSIIIIRGSQTSKISLPNLDTLREKGLIKVYEANDRASAIRMFLNGRAKYLWGIGDIKHDIRLSHIQNTVQFLPVLTRPIAVWFNKSRPQALTEFDNAFEALLKKSKP